MTLLFKRVKNVIDRLQEVLKCQKCYEMKIEDSMLFYRACDHFFCRECIGDSKVCYKCENPHDRPLRVTDDKSILSLYQSLVKFELPSKKDITSIYESCLQSKEDSGLVQEENNKNETVVNLKKNNTSVKKRGSKKSNKDLVPDKEVIEKIAEKNNEKLLKLCEEPLASTSAESIEKRRQKQTSVSKAEKSKKISLPVDTISKGKDKGKSLCSNTPKNTPSGSKININKRNPKGETQLHLACKKSNFDTMKILIDAGANSNAKDNAGWTPLHDSVFSGNVEVIKFLLENGANVNLPGLENTTALHEAIAKGNIKVVKLLLEYGADINAMNIFRETPLDLVTKYNLTELKEIILEASSAPKTKNFDHNEKDDLIQNIIIYKYNLQIEHEKLVNKFAEKFNANMVSSLTGKISPTHIIVSDSKIQITWGMLLSVLNGCWLVKSDWIKESLEENTLKPCSSYEVSNDISMGFVKARVNKKNQLPGLFSGCHFFFGGNFEVYNFNDFNIKKDDVKSMVEKNGGIVLKRCPDPESLALEKTIPYHANPSGPLRETSYFIIYQSQKWDPKPKYNMSHFKTLPFEWLISCVYKFELIDPNKFTKVEFL